MGYSVGKIKILGAVALAFLFIGVSIGVMIKATSPSIPTVIEPGSMVGDASYVVFTDGVNYVVKNETTGAVDFSSTNASATIQYAIDNINRGTILIRAGTYVLTAWQPVTVSGTYYCSLVLSNKSSVSLIGEGIGSTILRLAPSQYSLAHPAVMLFAGPYDSVTVSRMTFDGNKDNQDVGVVDGAGCILTGGGAGSDYANRNGSIYSELNLINSPSSGAYFGNNRNGLEYNLTVSNIRSSNNMGTGIVFDTVQDSQANGIISKDDGKGLNYQGLAIIGANNYKLRHDFLSVSDVLLINDTLGLNQVNQVAVSGLTIDDSIFTNVSAGSIYGTDLANITIGVELINRGCAGGAIEFAASSQAIAVNIGQIFTGSASICIWAYQYANISIYGGVLNVGWVGVYLQDQAKVWMIGTIFDGTSSASRLTTNYNSSSIELISCASEGYNPGFYVTTNSSFSQTACSESMNLSKASFITVSGNVTSISFAHHLWLQPTFVSITANTTACGDYSVSMPDAFSLTITFVLAPMSNTWLFYWYAGV